MEKTYSLDIHPRTHILALAMSMKEQLATEVGWFTIKNSLDHITIFEFNATEKGIEKIKNQISKACDTQSI
ncbi:hypothetical protein [Flavobacterium sp. A45]|uniref:hypothetical protein n=1 Tax=Flavobacterium sp. A45 TaxID=1945862 RepID=UPI000987115D|nr:hypothetical protein [Flavobacterium sp. A45]OOG75179.1 hypothetical protein B0E44_05390 [Flavobacterium sp. A45]